MILVDCAIGPPSFLQVNMSGGEPREVQDSVTLEPMAAISVELAGVSITGVAVNAKVNVNAYISYCN